MLKKSNFTVPDHKSLADLNAAFDGERPERVLEWLASNATEGEVPLVSSFGADSVVLLHMISQIDRDFPVLFIDTGKHFMETLRYRDTLKEHFGLENLQSIQPDRPALKGKDPFGSLWISDADACCDLRKTQPLANVMINHAGWITGRKHFQTGDRSNLAILELDNGQLKVNPLASWGPKDVANYIKQHSLPGHPLVPRGYLSIGCAPCTSPVKEGEDPRAGRWKGTDKTECGLHI
ncbi:phosphoadenylyl-sulfate reductase [Cohaesibacter celericrescens]|uniref:Adenosine 5'-phosphosulfate reductase n=1 Tax=Cohaesibacter celericrescens TaxID=2067669 RepID=A0A2N5XSR3_9HYPH|nr:phosphoadenylyl-sulfate reductase [Cohaesibacter celericrescens]PLW77553.1 phosphoadenylyl-sulfate reductase [Cohaesibacter celericrescens]